MISSSISWIPESLWIPILLVKGGLALLSVILLIFTMVKHWNCCYLKWGQKARFICLLGFAVLSATATSEQIADDITLGYRHLGALIMAGFLIYVCWVSLEEPCLARPQGHTGSERS